MNWTDISHDPNNVHALLAMGRHLNSLATSFTATKLDLMRILCQNRQLLDIGASGHNPTESLSQWPHEQLRQVASDIMGLDIDADSCARYTALGYHFVCMDATSEAHLGRHFDLAYCGDIIEHVNNPVALMRFVERHLHPGGLCVVSTPNPYFKGFRQLVRNRQEFFYTPNLQHISWIVPANMMEILRRCSGLELTHIYVPQSAVDAMHEQQGTLEEYFHEYIYVLRKSPAPGNAFDEPA